MPRVKIDLPESFPFDTEISVRVSDINYGGHLSNDAVLSLMHEARLRFLQNYGFNELDIGGTSLIMADTAISYKSEAFQGDQLKISVAARNFTKVGFDLYYKLFNHNTGKDTAHAKTGMVSFDYENRKVVPVPDEFREKVGQ